MTLSPELITALGTAIAAVLVSVGTLIVSINNGKMAKAAKTVAAQSAATALKSADKIEEVHVLVNGGLTEQKVEIARLSKIIAELTGKQSDESHADVTADQAKDSVKLSADMMKKLPNG